MKDLFISAVEIGKRLKNRSLTCKQLLDATYQRIDAVDHQVKAYVSLMTESAYQQADAVDKLLDAGQELGPLAGVPIAIKDNICTKGYRTTCSSKMLEHFVAPYDATVMTKLHQGHLISIGKTNLDEFAMGSSTENSAFFTSRNPWNLDYVPGGSSGGSSAAVVAGEAFLSLGSDTGGSIRQPASFCGIVGIKPSYGRVSRYGLVAFASSLDQIGPFTRTVEDAAHILNVICGSDPLDSTSADLPPVDFSSALGKDIKGLKIGVPREMMGDKVSLDVKEAIEKALDVYRSLGAMVDIIDFDMFEYAVSTYYIIAPAEASANLARFDGVRYGYRDMSAKNLKDMFTHSRGQGFGHEVQRRILLGTYVLSSGYYDAYYLRAQKVRTLIKDRFAKFFSQYDVMMTPTSPSAAFKVGDHASDPLAMYLADIATIPANMAGLPGMSIPCGFSEDGLPIGLQILGKAYDELTVLKAGDAYQHATQFHLQQPAMNRVEAI
jgi:aspartyl-tRNA(Asn)/glutamyl-tRNA(Gln) amidotransferase subunit A